MGINERRYILVHIARRFAGRVYEIDELVNEAWLNPNVRAAETPSRLFIAGRWAMISYMHKEQKDGRRKYKIYFRPLINEDGVTVEPIVAMFDRAEFMDSLERAVRGLTKRQKLVVHRRMQGCELKDIAKILGVSRERVRQIGASAYAQMRIWFDIASAEMVA